MPTFYYKASNTSGKMETGTLDVPDKKAALQRLERMGLFPLKVSDTESSTREINFGSISFDHLLPSNRISAQNVLYFTDKLSTLIRAGLPLAKALGLLIDTTDHEPMRNVAKDILKDVSAGESFAEALAKHPKVFERLYINMVRSGEAAGVLDKVLGNVRDYLKKREEMKSFLITSLIYPGFMALTGLGTVMVLVFFVLPRFQKVFEQIGQDMPFITQILVDAASFMSTWKWLIIFLVVGGWFSFKHWLDTPEGRMKWDTLKLKLPVLGTVFSEIEVNRFAQTLGILLQSSVSLLDAMAISKDITENKVFYKAMDPIIKGIKKGDGMSLPMKQSGIFPKEVVQLVTVGEESGQLGPMFTKIAVIYQTSLEKKIARVMSMFEPMMILFMFVVVGFIVASMMMAVTSLSTGSM